MFRTAAVLAGVVAVLYFARDILIPLALAVTLTLILSPAVGWLQKMHIRRVPGTLLVMLVMVSTASGIGYVILNQLVQVVSELPAYRENIQNKIAAVRAPNKGALGKAARSVQELGKELASPQENPAQQPVVRPRSGRPIAPTNPLAVQVVPPPENELVYLRDVTKPFLGPIAKLGIVLVFTLFLLVEESDLRNRIFRLAGLSRLNLMTQAVADGTRRISRYLMLQFLVNTAFGLLCGLGLYFMGVPYAALWGTVAALLRIVPYVGSVVAGLLPLLLSLAVFDGWRQPLMVFALFATLELVTGNLLEPWLYGAHTGISSLALLVTTMFWAALWGPAGLILSTPLTVCVVVLGRHVPQLSFLHILLGDQPVLAPDAHLYQRLLAMDDMEARTVAQQYRNENSLAQLYDTVILPALTMAEQDRHKGALDPEREEFLFLTVREMIADFCENGSPSDSHQPDMNNRASMPERILCLPAADEADEIASSMLAQLLEQAGCATISFPIGLSPLSMLGPMEPTAQDVFCISAIQPFAFSHARTLSRELKSKFPRTKILIGVWGFNGETERALVRFQPSPPDKFVSSLAEALDYLGVAAPNAKTEVPV
ncbi:MAG TPA: AI-2E family transporter [Bryobacteraceae bacterium]|nr:AI-2E family transporter [Bryobacteraceae bacterium]